MDVLLHVYNLETEENQGPPSFLLRMLPSMGMGAYHTSLEVDGFHYTFAANAAIIRTSSRNAGVPSGASFKETIDLGMCNLRNRGEIATVIKKMEAFFKPNAYHLVHRNCNHFSETFATAIIKNTELSQTNCQRLSTYPVWINRLANTGSMVISHDDDIVPCNVLDEARAAAGQEVSWDLNKEKESKKTKEPKKQTKKTLTDAQKAALAKIRKK
jgi:hypothetical protein